VKDWGASRVARAAGARLESEPPEPARPPGPLRASIDSRHVAAGDLFVGLRGERSDGGRHAAEALRAGAWGVLVAPEHVRAAVEARPGGTVLSHPDPLAGLQALAGAWRRELRAGGTRVVAITGSTGKTSTKEILAALLSEGSRTVSSSENFNTEIGLPLAVLAAPSDTEVLVLEMAMRGAGQIAELTAIAEPDVGVIVNVGPVHLELLGTLEAIAAAKAELIAGLQAGATVVVPVGEQLLASHLRDDVRTVSFGDGGDFSLEAVRQEEVVIRERERPEGPSAPGTAQGAVAGGGRIALRPSFRQEHNLRNLLAAVAVARRLGVSLRESVEVSFPPLRGELVALPRGVVLINDCYNANPMSMRAAIDELSATAPARRVAVLGDMLELGPAAPRFHREIGEYAAARGVELLVTVGPLAAEMAGTFAGESHSVSDPAAAAELLETHLRDRDTVLVKGSRGVGLERVAEALEGPGPKRGPRDVRPTLASRAGPGRR
jgi:UDP-N-acetylmuramoyl-tripeptide--D-alanyl-D-alanine ligase